MKTEQKTPATKSVIRVKVLRQAYPGAEPYWQTFAYDGPLTSSVAGALDYLNYRDDIVDIDGNAVPRISWECSCLQGMCGGCAMVINGRPALACSTFMKDLGEEVTLEPLKKFFTVSDLVVDRTNIQNNLLAANAYIAAPADTEAAPKEYEHRYDAAKCLKCGLCLEVCPNYVTGENFFGAAFANDCYLIASKGGAKTNAAASEHGQDGDIKDVYDKHFAAGCSKSLSCMDVCPMEVPTLASMAKMNRKKR